MSELVPEVYVPDTDELESMLAARRGIEERVRYVRSLLEPVVAVARMRDNYERELARQRERADSMTEELHNLRAKLGSLTTGERTALDQRYDMLGKIKRARGRMPVLRQRVNELLDEIEKELQE